MRRTAVVAVFLALCSGACVSVDPVEPGPGYYPATYDRPRRKPPHRDRGSVPPKCDPCSGLSRTPRGHPGWMPHCGRISPRWTTIVIHHSGTGKGGAKAFDRYHREENGWDELGYHFVIGNGTQTPNGHVEVGTRWHKQKHGAHCKTRTNYYNEHGIGICLVGNFNESRPTPKQLASLNRLARFLCTACDIPLNRVTTHGAITHQTQCPGRYFDLAALQRSLGNPRLAASVR